MCDRQGRIDRPRFAIDGVTLPSNAAKASRGTRKELRSEAKKRDGVMRRMLARQRYEDLTPPCEPLLRRREARQVERLQQEAEKIGTWLQAQPEDRRGVRGGIRKAERTDNDSAKMATGQGGIPGDTGGAVVDEQHQSSVDAQAHGGTEAGTARSRGGGRAFDPSGNHGHPRGCRRF